MWRIVSSLFLMVLFASCQQQTYSKSYAMGRDDSLRLEKALSIVQTFPKNDIQSRIKAIQRFFIETPYMSGTLDKNINEKVVLNLQEFDCVTFVESVLALAMMDGNCDDLAQCYGENIEALRYRKGVCKGYASRLHYFSEWLEENKKHQRIKEIIPDGLTKDYSPEVSYMSMHPDKYKQLKGNKLLVDSMRQIEDTIRSFKFNMVPQTDISKINVDVQDGDVIAIVTNLKGLDITHAGFAWFLNGELHFLHASSQQGKVLISKKSLHKYVNDIQHMTGVIVFRPQAF